MQSTKDMLKNLLSFEQDAGLPASCYVTAQTEMERGWEGDEEGGSEGWRSERGEK